MATYMHFDWHQPSDRTTYKQHSEQPRHFIEEKKHVSSQLSLQTSLHLTRKSLYSPMSDAVRKHDE